MFQISGNKIKVTWLICKTCSLTCNSKERISEPINYLMHIPIKTISMCNNNNNNNNSLNLLIKLINFNRYPMELRVIRWIWTNNHLPVIQHIKWTWINNNLMVTQLTKWIWTNSCYNNSFYRNLRTIWKMS